MAVAGGFVVVGALVVFGGLLVDALLVDGGLLVVTGGALVVIVDVVPLATVREATGWVVDATVVVTGDGATVEREPAADVVGDDVGLLLDDGVFNTGVDEDDVPAPDVASDDDAAVVVVDPALEP